MCHNCATEDHRIFCRLRSTPRLRAFGRVAAAVRDASLRETVGIGSRSSSDFGGTKDEPYVRGALGGSPTLSTDRR